MGRAALSLGGDGVLRLFGGAMETEEDELENHSYEAEMEAVTAVLHHSPALSIIVIMSDSLSGVLAGGRFRHLPFNARAKCYRDDSLATVILLEDRHRVVVFYTFGFTHMSASYQTWRSTRQRT